MDDNDDKTSDYVSLEKAIKLWPKCCSEENQWLPSAAGWFYGEYRSFRQDLCQNATVWNYSEYCERVAFHYYSIACFFNDLFRQYGADLGCVRKWLINCLEKLNEDTTTELSKESFVLKTDAEQCLAKVNQLFHQLKSQKITAQKQTQLGLDYDSSTINSFIQKEKNQLHCVNVLKVINKLENELSLPKNEHIITSIDQCSCLAEIYKIANRSDLSDYYNSAMQKYVEKIDNRITPSVVDERDNIDKTIASEVKDYKSTVKQIVSYLEESYCKPLSSFEIAYIEKKYLDLCTDFWHSEVSAYLKKLTDDKNSVVIRNIFASLDSITNLETIPHTFIESEYLNLLKLLKLSEDDEKKLAQWFKQQCLTCVVEFSALAELELRFIENFVDFLSLTTNLKAVIVGLELEFFLRDEITLQDLLVNVSNLDVDAYGEGLSLLQASAQCFEEPYDMFMLDRFKHAISGFIQPVMLNIKMIDGRLVAEVTGTVIVLSKQQKALESQLKANSKIEEIRFVAAQVLHIDSSFDDAIWKGKNIVVLAKTIKVHDSIKWDVSGKDNGHEYTKKAAEERDGSDGFAGESGGNVLVLCKRFDRPESFTLLSNGGMGSAGQDGGDGKDGPDGKGIEKKDLHAKYKILKGFAVYRIREFVSHIEKECSVPPLKWKSAYNDNYVKALTDAGNEVVFSFCRESIITRNQFYFIYKGSPGKPGTQAGKGGLGGEGGFGGHIEIENYEDGYSCFQVAQQVEKGPDGQTGQGGLSGKHGKNGWDMSFMDFILWPFPKYYGEDYKSTCTATCYTENSSERVVCPYNGNKFVGITVSKLDHPSQERFRNENTKKNQERQHHARAVSKKTISKGNILKKYAELFDHSVESTLQSLHSDLDRTKQRAQEAFLEDQVQQSKINTDIKVERNFQYNKLKTHLGYIEPLNFNETVMNFDAFLKQIRNSQTLTEWAQLDDMEVSFDQVQIVFSEFRRFQNNTAETEALGRIEQVLMKKCQYAVLQVIANQIKTISSNATQVLPSADYAAKYLIECSSIDSPKLTHEKFGTLENCLNRNEQHDNIVDYALNESHCGKSEILMHSIRRFFQDVAPKTSIETYYKDYKVWMDEATRSNKKLLIQFVRELSKPVHAELSEHWQRSFRDVGLNSQFEFIVQQSDDLTDLYKRYINNCVDMFDCRRCLSDDSFMQEFIVNLKAKGVCFRELLAYAFNVNLRVYEQNEDREYVLFDNHNPQSSCAVHFLFKDETFINLTIDSAGLELDEQRIKEGDQFANIMREIKLLKDETQVYQYLIEQIFLKHPYPMANRGKVVNQDVINDYISRIVVYFSESDQYLLKKRLGKVISAYEKNGGQILATLLDRFLCEGRYVTCQEMCCILNYILKSSICESLEGNHFVWIFAAYRQRDWIAETLLLQLEAYFKRQIKNKSVWRKYLQNTKQRNVIFWLSIKLTSGQSNTLITEHIVDNILKLLSEIPNEAVSVLELNLTEWVFALKEKYWTYKLSQLISWGELPEKISLCSYYVHSMEDTYGQLLVEKLFDHKLMKLFSVGEICYVLQKFYSDEWNLNEDVFKYMECYDVSKWIESMQKKFLTTYGERNIVQLLTLTKCNKNVSNNLQKIQEFVRRIRQQSEMAFQGIQNSSTENLLENAIKNWIQQYELRKDVQSDTDNLLDVLAVIVRAIQIQKRITLRDTQLLTILTMLSNNQSTLTQVSTGEGKSLIVVSVAIVKSLLKEEKVDIITSSSVLAKRDAETNRDIFNLFGINVSHNCSEDAEKRRMVYSGNPVVYGDLANFQRDYLLDRFYQKQILGDRNFQNVIVDEVDSMLLDKGNNMLYLSHNLADFDKLESVYIFIWQWINRPARDYADLKHAFDADAIKEAIMWNIHGMIKPEDIEKLDSKLSDGDKRIIWERLVEAGLVEYNSKLCVKEIDKQVVKDLLKPEFERYADRMNYLIQECIEREKHIHIPNHLVSFVEQHLDSWITSAITAFYMQPGRDYVVDVDRSGTRAELNPNIIILDRDTGTDQASSQWEAALHQFLQIKHGCKVSLQSLKAVFISNVSYLKKYKYLYGLTGTLGSQRERSLLEELYNVDFVTIPTAKCKQFSEIQPILCNSQNEWVKRIVEEAVKQTEEKGRSVLIICETVNEVENLHTAFGGKTVPNIFTYTRDYEEFDNGTDEKKLDSGKIIIATNLAGRGTDVKITEKLRSAGGLHVCLTFLPSNIRIEQQAFGRAARCGDLGSGQLILLDLQGQQYNNARVMELKKQRDAEELQRISDVKTYYETHIRVEENLFDEFKQCYESLQQKLSETLHEQNVVDTIVNGTKRVFNIDSQSLTNKLEELLLHSCLDKWVFWLDKHNKQIGKENSKIKSSLQNFLKQLVLLRCDKLKDLPKWVEGNPPRTIKLGKFLMKNNEIELAKQLFDTVIGQEPHFSEAAHYYKAYALAKQSIDSESTKRDFKRELSEASRLFSERQINAIRAGSIVGNIKKDNSAGVLQIDAFEEQQKSFCEIYQTFAQSIDDILNHEITPQKIMNDAISEDAAEKLISKLCEKGVLKGTRIAKNLDLDKLSPIAKSYGIPLNSFESFLTQRRGSSIDLNNFTKELKNSVPLASRERFWKALVKQGALVDEKQYAFVEQEAFNQIETSKKNELEPIALLIDANDLVLYPEFIEEQKNCAKIFLKTEFKKIVGTTLYVAMKQKGSFTTNKKASFRAIKGKPVVFEHFDSLKRGDFSHIGITESECLIVLTQLIEARIIQESAQSDIFVAGEYFNAFRQLKLSACPIYEDAVIALLATTFTYRIALQAITEEHQASRINLQVRPHHSLLAELLEQRIVKPVTAASRKAWDKIQQRRALEHFSSVYGNSGIEFSVEIYSTLNSIENIITEVLSELKITAKGTTQHVLDTLDRCKGSLRALKVPEGQLISLVAFFSEGQFSNAEEIYLFSINGMDHLLKLGEKKWTWEMIRNTITVIALGVAQIALGAVIELYSVGLMTHVGGACISEGVNDIFFAAGALKSGYFSWKEYREQKLQSLKMTILSAGIGAYLSRGVKVSRYGYKLAGPHLQATGKNIAAICGKELIKEVGRGVIVKEVAKRIALKTIHGIAFGMANASVDYLMENYLRTLCSVLAAKFFEVIETSTAYQSVTATLNEVFTKLGQQEAKEVVSVVTKEVFSGKGQIEELTSTLRSFAGGVLQGLGAAMKKRSMTDNPLELPMQAIGKALTFLEYTEHIIKMTTLTEVSILQLNYKLNKEFKKRLKKGNLASLEHNADLELECSRFTDDAIANWKQLLRQQAEQIIEQHFVAPILKKGVNCLVIYAGKQIQRTYQTYKENKYSKCFEELKEQHKEELAKIGNRDDAAQAAENLKEQYHKDLVKLMKKTCNPKLFADILRENVPMDITCVGACSIAIAQILKSKGIENPSFTIVVETDDGLRQEFSSNPNGEKGAIIPLILENGHFQTLGDSITGTTNNNCLCTAVLGSFGVLGDVSEEQLRDQIANTVQTDPRIMNHIQQGWHKFPLTRGAFGGRRDVPSGIYDDLDSADIDDMDEEKENKKEKHCNVNKSNTTNEDTIFTKTIAKDATKDNVKDAKNPDKIKQIYIKNKIEHTKTEKSPEDHIYRRFLDTLKYAATECAVSVYTKIDIELLTNKTEKVVYKDIKSSELGDKNIDAAHVVAAPQGENSEPLKKHPEADYVLAKSKGHTHLVNFRFNRGPVGKAIDTLQRDELNKYELQKINMEKPTEENKRTIAQFKQQFLAVLEIQEKNPKASQYEKDAIKTARQKIENYEPKEIFKTIKNTYNQSLKEMKEFKPDNNKYTMEK